MIFSGLDKSAYVPVEKQVPNVPLVNLNESSSSDGNFFSNQPGVKTTRFLDDEYPSLGFTGLPNCKREPYKSNKNQIVSTTTRHDKYVKERSLSNETNHHSKDIDSASEWETDNEESNSKSSLTDEKEVLKINSNLQNLNFQDSSRFEFTNQNYSQPKSILRRISKDDSKVIRKETGIVFMIIIILLVKEGNNHDSNMNKPLYEIPK